MISKQEKLLGIVHPSVFFLSDENYVLHFGVLLALQLSSLASSKFRQHLVYHLYIVSIPVAIYKTKSLHIRIFAQIFKLALLIVCINGNAYCANFCTGVHYCKPVRYIGRPNADMRASGYSNFYESFCQPVNSLI